MNKNSGLVWHCHHNILMEFCYDLAERINCIKNDKDAKEVPIRLKLFKFVSDSAIAEMPKEVLEAEAKRREAYAKRRESYAKWGETYAKWIEAEAKRKEADAKWIETSKKWKETNEIYKLEIEKIHSKDCGCKEWNGKEIVFEEKI